MEFAVTGGWWRTNFVPLAVVAVLLPATVGVIAINEWSGYNSSQPTQPLQVAPGDDVVFDGSRIGPAKASFVDEPSAPPGSRLVRATVLVTPGDEPISCGSPQLRELSGAMRQWNESSRDFDREYDPNRNAACDSERHIRYSLTLEYLVPDDATGPFAVIVDSSHGRPQFVRLIVEP